MVSMQCRRCYSAAKRTSRPGIRFANLESNSRPRERQRWRHACWKPTGGRGWYWWDAHQGRAGRPIGHEHNKQCAQDRATKVDASALQSGWTALHCAVANGHLTTARLLVECGANLEAKTDVRCETSVLAFPRGSSCTRTARGFTSGPPFGARPSTFYLHCMQPNMVHGLCLKRSHAGWPNRALFGSCWRQRQHGRHASRPRSR